MLHEKINALFLRIRPVLSQVSVQVDGKTSRHTSCIPAPDYRHRDRIISAAVGDLVIIRLVRFYKIHRIPTYGPLQGGI